MLGSPRVWKDCFTWCEESGETQVQEMRGEHFEIFALVQVRIDSSIDGLWEISKLNDIGV